MVAHGLLPDAARAELDRDFPKYESAGFFPYDEKECGASMRQLVAALTSRTFVDALGDRLGIENLGQYPAIVHVCRYYNKRHGTIHTDSKSKVATALLYLNERWPETSDGCLRFLSGNDDIDAMLAPEIKPLYGEFAMFRRCDNSFHGLLPYEGERRVIQVAWLASEAEMRRKNRRGRVSRTFKALLGGLDRKFGANRGRNAAHSG